MGLKTFTKILHVLQAAASPPACTSGACPEDGARLQVHRLFCFNLCEFPVEVHDEPEQDEADGHEQHKDRDPQRKHAACAGVADVSQEQNQVTPRRRHDPHRHTLTDCGSEKDFNSS